MTLNELIAELQVLRHTEQHLCSAEKALAEKDKEIQKWKESYRYVVERNAKLRKALREISELAIKTIEE